MEHGRINLGEGNLDYLGQDARRVNVKGGQNSNRSQEHSAPSQKVSFSETDHEHNSISAKGRTSLKTAPNPYKFANTPSTALTGKLRSKSNAKSGHAMSNDNYAIGAFDNQSHSLAHQREITNSSIASQKSEAMAHTFTKYKDFSQGPAPMKGPVPKNHALRYSQQQP